ncbi:MAG: hypothetical protein P8Q14_09180 [Vicingaceae bacterium]|nr:hypothetical protein [Vicingaceae bacterium]
MKKIIFFLIVSTFLISCGSQNNTLSQFSKRKYLKKYKPSKKVKDDPINTYAFEQKEATEAVYAAKEVQPKRFVLNEIEEDDYAELILPQKQYVVPLQRRKFPSISKLKNKFVLEDEKEVPAKRKLHSWTIVTISLLVSALLSLSLVFYAENIFIYIVFGFPLLILFSAAAGITALNKIKKSPEKYWGRGWSSVAIGLGLLATVFLSMMIQMVRDPLYGS